jgi:hypothetical protein
LYPWRRIVASTRFQRLSVEGRGTDSGYACIEQLLFPDKHLLDSEYSHEMGQMGVTADKNTVICLIFLIRHETCIYMHIESSDFNHVIYIFLMMRYVILDFEGRFRLHLSAAVEERSSCERAASRFSGNQARIVLSADSFQREMVDMQPLTASFSNRARTV